MLNSKHFQLLKREQIVTNYALKIETRVKQGWYKITHQQRISNAMLFLPVESLES